jgi:hypothetical protein
MPRREGPLWVFDDEERGLKGEAFVGNASSLIDALASSYGVKPRGKKKEISLLFSASKFPDSTRLKLVSKPQNGDPGVTYEWSEEEAWLCPAFFCYFDPTSIPEELYAMVV